MMGDNGTLDVHDHDGSILVNSVIYENENLNVTFLEDLDSYLDDINNQLAVSRFVSDLDTKGMLNSVETETEATENIAHVSSEEYETSNSHLILDKTSKDEYDEHRLLEENVESCGKKSLLLEKTEEIAGFRRELELISMLLTGHENGDIEALEDQKRADQLSVSIVSASYDKPVGSVTLTPEKLEDLRRLSQEQLINHFKTEMNQMKREYDYTIQEMTEEYFSTKRRYLNLEKRSSFPCLKKNKEIYVVRKKIPDIISKLDKVLMEGEDLVFEGKNQLDSLLLENHQLKDSLLEAGEKMSLLSQAEANHRKLIQKLESEAEDSHVKASIYTDVYGVYMGEFVKNQIQSAKERTDLEHHVMSEAYESISKDFVNRETSESKSDLEDSCAEWSESHVGVEYCTVIYKEAYEKLGELNMEVSEKEQALRSEFVEKERLKEEIHWLECLVKEKENLVQITEYDLATEREKFEIVYQQINDLQYQIDQQAAVFQYKNKEVKAVLERTEGYEMEISELRQNLELTENEKMKSELKLSAAEAEQKRLKNQFVSTFLSLARWTKVFDKLECLVADKTEKTNSRLKSMQNQLSDLLDDVDELKTRESMFKRQMKRKTCDLQKAETEVDLLGDEIKYFLNLLEKIYIAIDHYSPILKHYPGIIEILKLVRRELRGESKRSSVF